MEQVSFTAMKDGTKEDYEFLTEHETEYTKGTADRLLHALEHLDEGLSGYKITRLGHSVQSATRAWRRLAAPTSKGKYAPPSTTIMDRG